MAQTDLRTGIRRALLGLGVVTLVASAVLFVSVQWPIALPPLELPVVVESRPHRLAPGNDVEAQRLWDRLARIGYRETEEARPGPGEFHRNRRGLRLQRPQPTPPGASLELQIDLDTRGRIVALRDDTGRRLREAHLAPEKIESFQGGRHLDRRPVSLQAIPPHLVDAVLVVEDRRFFEHRGLDLWRTFGAFLANVRARGVTQGGSTITQQLAKNVFLTHERTLARKLREAWLSLRLERSYDKPELLEAYLNTIYLGQRGPTSILGMEAAAQHYFGKSTRALDVGDAALLAGLIHGPGLYNPFTHPERAQKRRDRVLKMLGETGALEEVVVERALSKPLGTRDTPPERTDAPYFLAKLERDIEAVVGANQKALRIRTGLDAEWQRVAQRAVEAGLTQLEADFPKIVREDAPLQAALIAIDPSNGAIRALVGGRDWKASQFDRVTQARRQPGSVFKPVVALAGLARAADGLPLYTLASVLEDEPLRVETPEGVWEPANYDGEFSGTTNLRTALEKSLNVPIARLGLDLGAERIVATAEAMGIESPLRPVASLALGSSEVTPLEIAEAYALLANGGYRIEARSFEQVQGPEGPLARIDPERVEAFAPAEVALVTSALRGAVERGTGRGLRARGYRGDIAGKTGTTNDHRDAWFVGYAPELVVVAWVGYDDGKSFGLTGAQAALPIVARFLVDTLGARGGASFRRPPHLERVAIHAPTGLRAGFLCSGEPELFLAGTAPRERCAPSFFDRDRTWDRPREQPRPERPRRRRTERNTWFDRVLDAVDDIAEGR
ncbi:MAG: PBP1A family penicillin-binding protein [Myxococcota bacterium]